MSLAHLECHLYRPERANSATSSYVSFAPRRDPGSVVVACSIASRESIGSQVACHLTLEHFTGGILEYYQGRERGDQAIDGIEALEHAIQSTNSSVYHFGHRLSAGGRMSAHLMSLVIEGDVASAARIGTGGVYLCREGRAFPFFDPPSRGSTEVHPEGLVGAHSLVSVELSTIKVREYDTLLFVAGTLNEDQEARLSYTIDHVLEHSVRPSAALARTLFTRRDEPPFTMIVRVNEEVIELQEEVELLDDLRDEGREARSYESKT